MCEVKFKSEKINCKCNTQKQHTNVGGELDKPNETILSKTQKYEKK